MYVITYHGKPVTLQVLYQVEKQQHPYSTEVNVYLAAPTKQDAVDIYIHYFGFTWQERSKGVGCRKVGG